MPPTPPDHPRMRGEDVGVTIQSPKHGGSPPHARGRLNEAALLRMKRQDHPRMRGEDPGFSARGSRSPGSPPHARGRRGGRFPPDPHRRITPACAGKTDFGSALWQESRDHPRMRGEDPPWLRPLPPPKGSPPHARGRLHLNSRRIVVQGITPACAGKTPTCPY